MHTSISQVQNLNQDPYNFFRDKFLKLIAERCQSQDFPADLELDALTAQAPREVSHGDIACNVALILAKQVKKPPRDVAAILKPFVEKWAEVSSVEIAGAGFMNLTLKTEFWRNQLATVLSFGDKYGALTLEERDGKSKRVNVEYVSTNPTGPLHIGHCRVAILGDVLANLLDKAGYDVTREYYINDAGGQANELSRSVYKRYLEALGEEYGELGAYGGDYLIPVGKKLAELKGRAFVGLEEEKWLAEIRAFAIEEMMQVIREDLRQLGIEHDVFTSELSLIEQGKVQQAIAHLKEKDLVYKGVLEKPKGKTVDDWEEREQTLFRAKKYGDDTDRPLLKADNSWTYFASDVAYHFDKLERGSQELINVWGADHGGYVKRITSATQALADKPIKVTCLLAQLVRFMVDGEPVKMSKRQGTFITVRGALEKVGLEALRFMMVFQRADLAMDFDFKRVVEQTRDNPVFYVLYAYARAHSIKRHVQSTFPELDLNPQTLAGIDLSSIEDPLLIQLIQKIAQWPQLIKSAAELREPHRIPHYLHQLAALFHGLWNVGKEHHHLRFINPENAQGTQISFAVVQGLVTVLKSGFNMLGIQPREEM